MKIQRDFPIELLDDSIDACLEHFRRKLIRHSILADIHDRLINAIHRPSGCQLVHVFGPTGVGKTTLRHGLVDSLVDAFISEPEPNPGRTPVMAMEVSLPGRFRWTGFYRQLLTEADEPLIDYKIENGSCIRRNPDGRLKAPRRATERALHDAAVTCLRLRQPKALILDEAHHIGKVAANRMQDQMDVLKSLANATETLFILLGTYELLDMTDLSGQLGRRSLSIHFRRYRADNDEVDVFRTAVNTFAKFMPLKEEPALLDEVDFLYIGSMGCIGILKGWLERALLLALQAGAATVTRDHLEKTIMPQRKRLRITQEIAFGEKTVAETDANEAQIRTMLGLPSLHHRSAEAPTINTQQRKVGIRNPHRDPVGTDDDGNLLVTQ